MAEAFKCDRCAEYSDDEPEILKHPASSMDSYYEKELCHNCYHGWIEYVIGEPASEVNSWESFKIDPPEEDEDD